MLEEKILTDYFYVLEQLHLGKKQNLDELINMILINKYNLIEYYSNPNLPYDSILE